MIIDHLIFDNMFKLIILASRIFRFNYLPYPCIFMYAVYSLLSLYRRIIAKGILFTVIQFSLILNPYYL